ncbi:hypothetical protein [Planctobacterium marinum]|uniref:Uncharacterized protein n=1 Tax=Planctobacterium marinum TaxID=1631968 RepID=A0AA48HLD7_9ALTE|nr:hypothetical protein MACH26_11980 [Planctobacterium marinum]
MSSTFESSKTERINFIIAVCAILISAASFYATYIQADAAEKQVRAMTLPLLQFDHSNWDEEKEESILTFSLQNGGAGPAVLHRVQFVYEQQIYDDLNAWIEACCLTQVELVRTRWESAKNDEAQTKLLPFDLISSDLSDVVVTGQMKYDFLLYEQNQLNKPLWDALNKARHVTKLQTCYCSLLEECYTATGLTNVTPVNACE